MGWPNFKVGCTFFTSKNKIRKKQTQFSHPQIIISHSLNILCDVQYTEKNSQLHSNYQF